MKDVVTLISLLFFVSTAQAADNPKDILKDYFSISRPFKGSSTGTSFSCKLPKDKTIQSFEFR